MAGNGSSWTTRNDPSLTLAFQQRRRSSLKGRCRSPNKRKAQIRSNGRARFLKIGRWIMVHRLRATSEWMKKYRVSDSCETCPVHTAMGGLHSAKRTAPDWRRLAEVDRFAAAPGREGAIERGIEGGDWDPWRQRSKEKNRNCGRGGAQAGEVMIVTCRLKPINNTPSSDMLLLPRPHPWELKGIVSLFIPAAVTESWRTNPSAADSLTAPRSKDSTSSGVLQWLPCSLLDFQYDCKAKRPRVLRSGWGGRRSNLLELVAPFPYHAQSSGEERVRDHGGSSRWWEMGR